MRKAIILSLITILFCLSGTRKIVAYNPLQRYYSRLYKVIQIQDNKVVLKDCMGFTYAIDNQGDMELGDYFTAIVYDNNSSVITDDKIVKIRYERVDLF